MAIKRSIADLPDPDRPQGRKPDAEPRFVHLLVEQWRDAERENGPKPKASRKARFRHSDAGKCSRAIAYAALDVERTNPMDLSGYWNTGLGTIIHERWQEAVSAMFPDAVMEPRVLLGSGAGHIDAVVPVLGACVLCGGDGGDPDVALGEQIDGLALNCPHCNGSGEATRKVVIELKSSGGFAYKMAVGERGQAQGPKFEHITQGALNAKAEDADELVIAYLSKEAISVNIARSKGFSEVDRFAAEWTFTRDEYMPYADAEVERIDGILALLDDGKLPARKIPDPEVPAGAVITDPSSGQWMVKDEEGMVFDAGSWWACSYCAWQDVCPSTEPGRQAISEVAVELGIKS